MNLFTEALADENIKAELIGIPAGKADEDHQEGQTELFPGTDASALASEWLIMEDCGEKKADIAILNELYSYLLSCVNASCKNPVCMLMTVKKGDPFDEKLHRSVSGVKGGTVTEVLMQGCVSAENGRTIRRAIVRVSE